MDYSVFRMREADDKQDTFQQVVFFLTKEGKLYQIRFIERNGKKMIWGYPDQTEWDFEEIGEEKLIEVFCFFALHNPEEFRKLYDVLKRKDEKVFQCIEKARKEVARLYRFN